MTARTITLARNREHAMPKRFGSSPRTRGTDLDAGPERLVPQFIPASTGNRRRRLHPPRQQAVHPRGRGEQKVWDANLGEYVGSSPRTRGTALPIASPTKLIAVHPRGSGEHVGFVVEHRVTFGSSPRTRGTENGGDNEYAYGRFIPADAGNSWICSMVCSILSVHPRGRGEQFEGRAKQGRITGSSPRTRGTASP